MFQWESYVSLGVLLVLIIVIIVPRSVFTKSSSIKLYKEDKRLLFNSDPWPPAEQKLGKFKLSLSFVGILSL